MHEVIEGERSITTVLRDVAGNIGRIVRSEVQLARCEVTTLLARFARESGWATALLVGGAAVGQLALGFLLLAVVRGFESVVAPWLAALVVAVAAGVVAAALVARGLKQMKRVGMLSALRIPSVPEVMT